MNSRSALSSSDACVNVAQEYASPNTVCNGDELQWDTTSSSACADTYDPNSQLAGSACLDAGGAVPNATCYRAPAAISEQSTEPAGTTSFAMDSRAAVISLQPAVAASGSVW